MSVLSPVAEFINPPENPDIQSTISLQQQHLPTLWLLGKTGAGKSSLIHALTGDDRISIGNGFQPCTRTSTSYTYPQEQPLFRFLDTRGLAEANYDPTEDIAACQSRSRALIVVMKADDPEQSSVLNALQKIRKAMDMPPALLVHTGIDLIASTEEQEQCIAHNQAQVDKVWKGDMDAVAVNFEGKTSAESIQTLVAKLAQLIPILAQINDDLAHASTEEKNFSQLKKEVLWYSAAAGASDAIPAVGLVSVPAIQAKMLHSLACQYGVEWNKRVFAEFTAALGSGFAALYASKLGVRQLIKFIPVYGQTVGSATAAAMSFGSTYALGRVACKYLYHKSKGEPIPKEEMQVMYKKAFDGIKEVAKNETDA